MIRVVLDTNVLVSALLFTTGRLVWLRRSWQSGDFRPVLASATARELLRVLAYPKFRLGAEEIERLLADLLPWSETWTASIAPSAHRVADPHDQVFLDLALAAGVPVLVSGDADLLALRQQVSSLEILRPAEFEAWLSREGGA